MEALCSDKQRSVQDCNIVVLVRDFDLLLWDFVMDTVQYTLLSRKVRDL